jgi:hypothetical protein
VFRAFPDTYQQENQKDIPMMTRQDATTTGSALLDALGPLFLINLPHRQDRRREFAAQLDRIGTSFDDPRVRLLPAIRPAEAAGFPSIGARGCFLSHLEILRQARDAEGVEHLIICEDDLDFASDFTVRLPNVLAELATTSWDIFYGGHQGLPPDLARDDPAARARGLVRIDPSTPVRTTHFLAFRRRALAPLVSYLDAVCGRPPGHPDGGPMHMDGAYSRFRADHPDMVTLATLPALGHQRASRTDIHALRWYDQSAVTRSMVGWARRLKSRSIRRWTE